MDLQYIDHRENGGGDCYVGIYMSKGCHFAANEGVLLQGTFSVKNIQGHNKQEARRGTCLI